MRNGDEYHKEDFESNPENKYRVVHYQPTVDDLKNMILDLEQRPCFSLCQLERIIKENNFTNAQELINHPDLVFDVIFRNCHRHAYGYSFTGIQNIETGEIQYNFNEYIYSYHPDEGYVIFKQYCERDSYGGDGVLAVVSLKTGKQFDQWFIDLVSGIKNKMFYGVPLGSLSPCPELYLIDENRQELIFLRDGCECISKEMGETPICLGPNSELSEKYGIEFLDNPKFYINDPLFIDYMERKEIE